ncbi:MAG: EAL domain-containing protein [Pseudomonadales bacterium]|nr:EAL domain-containing protein [Pseudomonadales bacterium]
MNDTQEILQALLADLDIAVFLCESRTDTQVLVFQPIGMLPDWCTWFLPVPVFTTESELSLPELTEVFPYLDVFIPDAEALWRDNQTTRLNSGLWTQTDNEGKDQQLEAIALKIRDKDILVLVNLSQTYGERQRIYQRAREIALVNEQLIYQLNQKQRRLQSLLVEKLHQSPDLTNLDENIRDCASAVLICKPDGEVEVMNRALVNIYKVTNTGDTQQQSLLDKWLKEAESQYPEIKRVVDTGGYWEGEFESRNDMGETIWIRLAIGPVLDDRGALMHYICIANDISSFKKSGDEIKKLTDYDFTTQLPNRRHFWRKLTKLIDHCMHAKSHLSIIYIDLDHFKRINDTLGHHAGDYLLNTIATRLARCIKQEDFIAHLGGDEFAIILPKVRLSADLNKIATRLLNAINQETRIEEVSLNINASVGIASYPKDGLDATTLMKRADLAMFQAKELGRARFQAFHENMEYDFSKKVQLENDLHKALNEGQFDLHYQPQVCTGKDHYLRMEALIRWEHPTEGKVSPAAFIPIAEDSGLIQEIGHWVLKTACATAKQMVRRGLNVVVAVNVSAHQIKHPDFQNLVETVLKDNQLPAQHLELEITESILMQELDMAVIMLKKLRRLGVSISLDDFGSGYSSLNYLKQLPVDILKLDRAFIHELPFNEESQKITTSIISLAHELGIKVIAEGVENQDQADFLIENNCDYMQGYLFYYPVTSDQIISVIETLSPSQTP